MEEQDSEAGITAREQCVARFTEWWSMDELSAILSQTNPNIIRMFLSSGERAFDHKKLAEILYDSVGIHFLRNIANDPKKRQLFLALVLETVIQKGIVEEDEIVGMAKSAVSAAQEETLEGLEDVVTMKINSKWCRMLAKRLQLPPSVAEKEYVEKMPSTEVVEPHVPLNPLYDYQYSTGLYVRGMLEGTSLKKDNAEAKRKLIAVPTGSGKTRMIVETLIEWLNDGKPSKNAQQRDSKFILWIAQSNELCEQALSTFRSVFESAGRRGTTLRLHRFWGTGGALPAMGMDDLLDEKGVIIATIQSLYKLLEESSQLERLGRITSCIIVDEAHHAIAASYSQVLRKMGFNWENRKNEVSELGIILIGLTATPFRGTGQNMETVRLRRRFDGIYFPTIPYVEGVENFMPHALIDAPTFAYEKDKVRILGERSYDRGGLIDREGYSWTIQKSDSPDEKWQFEKEKNITFEFPQAGEYAITLAVKDNEGDSNKSSAKITINKPFKEQATPVEMQKHLYEKLIKRKILCEVYHKILASGDFELSVSEASYMQKFGEFGRDTLKSIGNKYERNKMILEEIHKLREAGKKKILFFGCSIEHSREICMFLQTLYGMRVRYVDSQMDMDTRVNSIEMFRSGDLEVLCNFDVLTTGFDAPNVDCVFVGRPIKSTLLYTQMIGRGMRGTKSGGTTDMLIVDIDDNFQIQDNFRTSVSLGWKIFKDYWKPAESEAQTEFVYKPPPKEASKSPEIDKSMQNVSYSCSKCGKNAIGAEAIQKVFGVEGSLDLLIEYLGAQRYDILPSECAKCRKAKS